MGYEVECDGRVTISKDRIKGAVMADDDYTPDPTRVEFYLAVFYRDGRLYVDHDYIFPSEAPVWDPDLNGGEWTEGWLGGPYGDLCDAAVAAIEDALTTYNERGHG